MDALLVSPTRITIRNPHKSRSASKAADTGTARTALRPPREHTAVGAEVVFLQASTVAAALFLLHRFKTTAADSR